MAEYIEREALREKLCNIFDEHQQTNPKFAYGLKAAVRFVDDAPAADVAPTPKWISVKDGLPEENRMVAIYLQWRDELNPEKTEQPECRVAMRRYGVWKFCPRGYYKITHWMPLPEPPKEDE